MSARCFLFLLFNVICVVHHVILSWRGITDGSFCFYLERYTKTTVKIWTVAAATYATVVDRKVTFLSAGCLLTVHI